MAKKNQKQRAKARERAALAEAENSVVDGSEVTKVPEVMAAPVIPGSEPAVKSEASTSGKKNKNQKQRAKARERRALAEAEAEAAGVEGAEVTKVPEVMGTLPTPETVSEPVVKSEASDKPSPVEVVVQETAKPTSCCGGHHKAGSDTTAEDSVEILRDIPSLTAPATKEVTEKKASDDCSCVIL